jgi:hypothetical protein
MAIDEKLAALLKILDLDDPERAAILREQIAELEKNLTTNKEVGVIPKITIRERFRVEKFDGDWESGKQPVEIIEGGDGLETTVIKIGGP